jgi:dihydroxy-acid dehydratase
MSGTAGGTIILHISPESAIVDSPFGILRNGDTIRCSLSKRLLEVDLTEDEIAQRVEERKAALEAKGKGIKGRRIVERQRGYRGMYEATVNQAEEGADFDFCTAKGEF